MTDLRYPRPQLVRETWQDLCGPWGFATDVHDEGHAAGWYADPAPFDQTIEVPYPPESKLSGISDHHCLSLVWYRRSFSLGRRPGPGERIILHFGAVDYAAQVWLNGTYLGAHEGGHTPFSFDITAALSDHDEQLITLRAEDRQDDGTQPRGKQAWEDEPHGVWYHRTTGIWQPVWLEIVPALHLKGLVWTSDVPSGTLTLGVELSQQPPPQTRIRVRISHAGQLLAEQTFQPLTRLRSPPSLL